ncbi:cysteine desulfurase family protein [Desulfoferula mesophila]|uniref:cysteine desulfurase n=1 Tax=Desulfoferula mesophila TaxID=3058419 RepID=A0AAU9E8H9_9BACT|nr:cysteine desulfurase NifS [Desulfoferula mesophilus]
MRPLYFDYNATTPILPRVYEAMRPYLTEHFGNPGSGHLWGLKAKRGAELAREQVAGLINCAPGEVYFTSCATESDNWALLGLGLARPGAHVVISAIEHPAIVECAAYLERCGARVSRVGVDEQGLVDPAAVRAACASGADLISVMLANNETGALQPVAEIAAWARKQGIPVHSDAAQAVGKVPVDVAALGVDLLTIAGHKLYAPKGVGALYVRQGLELAPLLWGGGQERGRRSGTENVPYMVALGEACALAAEDLPGEMARQRELGRVFLEGLGALDVDWRLYSERAPRLPGTAAVGFKGLNAGDIISGLVVLDVGVSAGAACHGDTTVVSHVLAAMGVPLEYAQGTIRFSWGRPTSQDDVRELVRRLGQALGALA